MIRKLICFLILFAFSTSLFSAVLPGGKEPNASEVMIPLMYSNKNITLADFMNLSPFGYKALTGTRLGLKHGIELKMTQKQLKQVIRIDGTVDVKALIKASEEPFRFHIGGFLLGFFLGIIGVIITLFFKDANRKSRLYSSLIGLGIVIILALLL